MSKSTSKNYRKFIASAAAMAVVAPMVAPVASLAAANFTDVEGQYVDAVEYLASKGIKGYGNGIFGTHDNITRQDAAVFVAKALGLDTEKAPNAGFTDVAPRAVGAANALKAEGITAGKSATTFGGGDLITRGELAKWIAAAFDLEAGNANNPFSDVEGHYVDAVKALVENEVTSGKTATKFGTHDNATRGQFAVFVYKASKVETDPGSIAVKSASAVNAKQVKLTGSALDKVEAAQLSLAGNKVLSVVANEDATEATVTFEKAVKSGAEQTLKLTEKVEGEADKVSEFKFTYTLVISSVKAVTTRIDEAKDAQFLKFNINGEATAADVTYLKEAGYTVEFQSTDPSVFVDTATGEIAEGAAKVAAGEKFTYKVVIKKGQTTVESELVEVTVVDETAVTTAITSYDLLTSNDVVVKSGKIALSDSNTSIANIKGTLLDGTKEASITDATFKSSNPAVAVINNTGAITPVAPGTVKFTVESGDAKVEVPVTIVADARVATTATASVSSSKLVNGATQSVNVVVKDQYGDVFKGLDLDAFDVKNSKNETIATTSNPAATDAEGKTTFTIEAHAANVGTGSLVIKNSSDKTLATISLTVGAAGEVASRKIELVDASKDLNLDIVKGSTDKSVDVVWNQYNADGFLIGPEANYDIDGAGDDTGKYTVDSSDTGIATVTVDSDGKISVTGGTKAGTATIKVLEGTVTRASFNVTVVDSTPTITSVSFEPAEILTAKNLDLDTEVIKPENIKINSDKTVSIDNKGVIYIEVANAGYNAADDITLGTVSAVSNLLNNGATVPVAIAGGNLGTTAGAALKAGDKGSIVVRVIRDGETTPVAVSTINVDVK